MPDQTYVIRLDPLDPDGDRIRVRIVYARRRVSFFSVQYEALFGGRHMAVVRYDASHDVPHRDLLTRDGRNFEKHWLREMSIDQALQHGLADLKANWRRYRSEFARREGFD